MFNEDYSNSTARGSAARANDPNLTEGELATMAREGGPLVRAVVAARPDTPLTSIVRLARDEDPRVRWGVATNPRTNIPEQVWNDLAGDKEQDVKLAVCENPAVPEAVLHRLASSLSLGVGKAARAALKARKNAKAAPSASVALA